MVNSKNIIAGLGVVAGLGVAMLPLTSYAETTDSQLVRATVSSTLAVSVEDNKTIAEGNTNAVEMDQDDMDDTLLHTVNVVGNNYNGYVLTIKAEESADLRLRNSAGDGFVSGGATIPALSGTGNITAGTPAWGYKHTRKVASNAPDFTSVSSWKGITTTAETLENYQNAAEATADGYPAAHTAHTAFDNDHYVSFAIATAADQTAGVYEATVTYEVTANTL
ncbi:hypothetical protein IJI72_02610 [Candidatus Saccharibacteria bacterium]|nr:hypothetical protein [Candidatus Saccharibacteria bacterium]